MTITESTVLREVIKVLQPKPNQEKVQEPVRVRIRELYGDNAKVTEVVKSEEVSPGVWRVTVKYKK